MTFTAPQIAALPTLPLTPEPGTYIVTRTSGKSNYEEIEDTSAAHITNFRCSYLQAALTKPPCKGAELKLLPFGETGDAWMVWVLHNITNPFEWMKSINADEVIIKMHPHTDDYPYIEIYDTYRE